MSTVAQIFTVDFVVCWANVYCDNFTFTKIVMTIFLEAASWKVKFILWTCFAQICLNYLPIRCKLCLHKGLNYGILNPAIFIKQPKFMQISAFVFGLKNYFASASFINQYYLNKTLETKGSQSSARKRGYKIWLSSLFLTVL